MRKTILIAASAAPSTKRQFNMCCDTIEEEANDIGLGLHGILWTGGPGCTNLAIDIEGDDEIIDSFANNIAIALMPAKWSVTLDTIKSDRICELQLKD